MAKAKDTVEDEPGAAPPEPLLEACERYHDISLRFENLMASSNATVTLGGPGPAVWSEGPDTRQLRGLAVSAATGNLLLTSLVINREMLHIQTSALVASLTIRLFVETESPWIRGRVNLPPGGSVTLESNYDRSSVLGLSSFAIGLLPE